MTKHSTVESWAPNDTEWDAATRCIYDAFGVATERESDDLTVQLRPPGRRVAVAESGEIFGGCFAYDFHLSLPGGATGQVGGLAGVGISPVAKGRGGLRSMMHTHLQQSLEHGDVASVLMASESGIYSRYGYGVATEMVQWHLNTQAFVLNEPANCGSDVKLLHKRAEVIPVLSAIHKKHCSNRPMELVRDELWWRYMLEPNEPGWVSVGHKKFFAVSYNDDGVADGYAIYSIDDKSDAHFSHGKANSRVVLTELCTNSLNAEKSLFSYLANLPWCLQLVWELGPVDPSIKHFMTDPRQLWQKSRVDMLWLRPLNVERLLAERSYGCDGQVVIDYTDEQFPQLSGRWQLSVENGLAHLQKSDSKRFVAVEPSSLATVYAGMTRVAELASVKKITGDCDSIAMLDRLLLVTRPPFNSTRF